MQIGPWPLAKGRMMATDNLPKGNSVAATLHLLRSPANARRLLASIEQVEKGETEEFDPTS